MLILILFVLIFVCLILHHIVELGANNIQLWVTFRADAGKRRTSEVEKNYPGCPECWT